MDKFLAKEKFSCFSTDANIVIVVDDESFRGKADEDLAHCKRMFYGLQEVFSRFDPDSELFALNGDLGKYHEASLDFLEVAQKSLLYFKESDGLFDPRVIGILEARGYDKSFKGEGFSDGLKEKKISSGFTGPKGKLSDDLVVVKEESKVLLGVKMDFSGLVKGYAIDKAVAHLSQKGWKDFMVDAGGDIFFKGLNEADMPWEVELEGFSGEGLVFRISDGAVATSGITRRKWEAGGKMFHHLIDPKNPQECSFELRSVTAVAENAERADILAKTLFLMGKERGLEYSQKNGIKSLFLDRKGNAWMSPPFKQDVKK